MVIGCFIKSVNRALRQEHGIQMTFSSDRSTELLQKSYESLTDFVILTSPYMLMDLGQGPHSA